jgi:hypothetical protein
MMTPQQHFLSVGSTIAALSCVLTVLPIELWSAQVHPIRYRMDERFEPDLSYMFGNSFDSVAVWEEHMRYALEHGVRAPDGYYWGDYLPLCSHSIGYPHTYLRRKHQALIDRVESDQTTLTKFAHLNLSRQRAYDWLNSNRYLREQFYQLAESLCR